MSEYLSLFKTMADLGGTAAISTVVIICIYKLFSRFTLAFIANLEKIAVAISDQAQSMKEMSDSVNGVVAKDNAEHREILLGVQVVGEELKSLVTEVRNLRREGNERDRSGKA